VAVLAVVVAEAVLGVSVQVQTTLLQQALNIQLLWGRAARLVLKARILHLACLTVQQILLPLLVVEILVVGLHSVRGEIFLPLWAQ
jgi:hypothetical protein